MHADVASAFVLCSGAAGASLVWLEYRSPRLRLAPVAVAIGIVMLAAVVAPPRSSKDVWSYTMYGRTVSVHHASPYDEVPAAYPSDPLLSRVSPRWRHRGSVYGPLFVGVAAAGTFMAGDSALLSRLFFQVVAALALLAILIVVWRTTRSVAAVAFIGLNPVLTLIVVNGGHNDAVIGLAILAAALLAARQRGGAVGAVIGAAALIKLTAGLALVGVVFWAWRHHLRRFAVTAVATAGAVVLVAYAPFLDAASRILGDANQTVTNASFWNPIVDALLHHNAWRNVPRPLAANDTLTAVFDASTVMVLGMALLLGWLAARRRRPEPAVGVAVAAYPIGAEYAFPWYAVWALPVLAGRRLQPVASVVWLQSIVMLAALKLPSAVTGNAAHTALRVMLTEIAPPVVLVAFVVAAIRENPPLRLAANGVR